MNVTQTNPAMMYAFIQACFGLLVLVLDRVGVKLDVTLIGAAWTVVSLGFGLLTKGAVYSPATVQGLLENAAANRPGAPPAAG